jgi:hypothetical protein
LRRKNTEKLGKIMEKWNMSWGIDADKSGTCHGKCGN